METSADSDALRRRHGLRLTAQRMAVPRAMSDRPHSTADNIYSVVRAEIADVSRPAVYKALAPLTERRGSVRHQPADPVRIQSNQGQEERPIPKASAREEKYRRV